MHADNYNALCKDNDSISALNSLFAKTDNAVINLRLNWLFYVTCLPKYSIDESENESNIHELMLNCSIVKMEK